MSEKLHFRYLIARYRDPNLIKNNPLKRSIIV